MPELPASPEPHLPERLARAITLGGPMPVARFMDSANAHYYASRDPLGAAGDFITAPEISQMFGELVGAWLADLWLRAGKPDVHYVELGPGRGTLAADALRAMARAGLAPPVHFVETSPVLRAMQVGRVAGAVFHDDVTSLRFRPSDSPPVVLFVGEAWRRKVKAPRLYVLVPQHDDAATGPLRSSVRAIDYQKAKGFEAVF